MSLHDDLVSVPSEEGGGKKCMGNHVGASEYMKNSISAFSHKAPEWVQLELETLFKQKNLLREV